MLHITSDCWSFRCCYFCLDLLSISGAKLFIQLGKYSVVVAIVICLNQALFFICLFLNQLTVSVKISILLLYEHKYTRSHVIIHSKCFLLLFGND